MHLQTIFVRVGLLAVAVLALNSGFAVAAQGDEHSRSSFSSHGGPMADCADLQMSFDGERAIVRSEEKTLTRAEAPTLRVHAETNGGVQLQGWDKDTYSVTTCKAAAPPEGQAEMLFSQIHVSIQGGEVSASGPERSGRHGEWSVFFLIRTPKGATVDLEATNGPLSLYGVDGKVTARVTNGPISLKDFAGDADVQATNGPISVSGSRGNVRIRTQNGPITVAVSETSWSGAGLTADAENGPVSLHVPAGFQSSFLVESRGHGPVSCAASICGETRKTWDDDRKRIEFGSGAPVIHLSSYNGPVSVK
jgi:hypothetical protein